MHVPFLDLKSQFVDIRGKILQRWDDILQNASFVGGKYVQGFEHDFAPACNTDHCVAVGNGTDALRFIFLALGIKPGDEVLVPVNTFIATSEAISQAGGIPKFVDIDSQTYNIDPVRIEESITENTWGIVPVHLYGQPADMDAINSLAKKYDLWVVEDACQAHLAEYRGKKAGSMGIAAAFSFYPGKNLGACGEAGAVTTNDEKLAEKVRMLRDHGQSQKYIHDIEGYNGRCDALQASALQVKLSLLPEWNKARREHAHQYDTLLSSSSGIILPFCRDDVLSVYHLYVVLVENRQKVMHFLAEHDIATGLHYPLPLHLQKAYSHLGYGRGDFPVAEKCAERLLSLPMYPELSSEQISFVCDKLLETVTAL